MDNEASGPNAEQAEKDTAPPHADERAGENVGEAHEHQRDDDADNNSPRYRGESRFHRGRGGRYCGRGGRGYRHDHACHGRAAHAYKHNHGCHGPSPFWGTGPGTHAETAATGGFDLPTLLSNLNVNLRDILSPEPQNGTHEEDSDIDFIPRADVFSTDARYIVHVSLPGAQKEDISVEYDAETSMLNVAGVVYRPGVDEEVSAAMVVDGRGGEVGVFERKIDLSHAAAPGQGRGKAGRVDVDGVTAKLEDGVLVVVLPKLARMAEKRRVSVEQVRQDVGRENEKPDMMVDSEVEVGDAGRQPYAAHARDAEVEEREYVAVDVD